MEYADWIDSIRPGLQSGSLVAEPSTRTGSSRDCPSKEKCCEANEAVDAARKPERKCASIRAYEMDIPPSNDTGERKRDKVKRFVAEKGPRIAGTAAAIGMFIFNVVSACS